MAPPLRVTQTFTIVKISDYLAESGWEVIYQDLPGSSRGGTGVRGRIFRSLEEIKSPTPDIIAIMDAELHIVEVDTNLAKQIDNLHTYKRMERRLKSRLSQVLEMTLNRVRYSFGRTGVTKEPARLVLPEPRDLTEFHYYYLDKNLEVRELAIAPT